MANKERTLNDNVPREFGAPIRRESYHVPEDFITFQEALYQHVWAHTTNNYGDYIRATKEEDRMFSRAMAQSLRGMDLFRRVKEDSIRELIQTAVWQAIGTERAKGAEALAKQKAAYEALLTPEQKALMAFRIRLEAFNWHYDYIDDGKTWRAHHEAYKALMSEARQCGHEFEQMWLTVHHEKLGKDADLTSTFDQHYDSAHLT